MPSTFELIQSYTLPSNQVSYTFTNIPQTYTDLVMVANVRTTAGSGYIGFEVRFNGVSTGNAYNDYGVQWSTSGNASVYHEINTNSMNIGGYTNSRWTTLLLDVAQYTNTNWFKRVLARSAMEAGLGRFSTGLWRSTAAVTSMTVGHMSISTDAGSVFSLYGIKAA